MRVQIISRMVTKNVHKECSVSKCGIMKFLGAGEIHIQAELQPFLP
jgi:hypothetical protein